MPPQEKDLTALWDQVVDVLKETILAYGYAVKTRYARDARRMNEEIQKVFSREGVSPVPLAGCLGTVAQAPALMALYSAVRRVAAMGGRFGWIRDISRPSLVLTVAVGAITAFGTMIGADMSAQNRTLLLVLPTIVTIVVLSKMAAGVALYWGMSSAFGVAQGVLAKRQTA